MKGMRLIYSAALCACFLLMGALPIRAVPLALAGITVVIDPGHGGSDWGVDPGKSGLREKDVVLDLAARLERQLQKEGATVYVTRRGDEFVSLGARIRFSNALLFRPDNAADHGRLISLHLNSNVENPNLTRVEVLVDPAAPADTFAVLLAEELAAVTEGGFGYRDAGYPPGVHPADVAPVRWTYPRTANVLSEAAFLSNATQAMRLRDSAWLEQIAAAHVRALRRTLQG